MAVCNVCRKRLEFHKISYSLEELIDRGGKSVLIGDANDFQEYAKAYYNVESEMNTFDMLTVCYENKITKDVIDKEEKDFKALSKPIKICITNAACPICYYLVSCITSEDVFGPGIEIAIRLLVSSASDIDLVKGTAMDAEDLANGLLRDIKVYTSAHEAFEDCSFVIVLDSLSRSYAESQKEWLARNQEHFSRCATIINDKALRTCKVLVAGNGPINYNATVMVQNAPSLSHKNIVAVSSVVEMQARSLIGEKLNVNPAGVFNMVLWGDINGKRYIDVSNLRVHGYDGAVKGPYWHSVDAVEMIHDYKWIEKDLPKLVTARADKVLFDFITKDIWNEDKSFDSQNYLTGLSTANSISNTIQKLCRGYPKNQMFSLGIYSEGWYAVPVGMFFSFPVTMDPKGCWNVVQDIELSRETKDGIEAAVQDLNFQMLLCPPKYTESTIQKDFSSVWDKFLHEDDTTSLWSHITPVAAKDTTDVIKKLADVEENSELKDGNPELENVDNEVGQRGDAALENEGAQPQDSNTILLDDNTHDNDENVTLVDDIKVLKDDNFSLFDDNQTHDTDNDTIIDDIKSLDDESKALQDGSKSDENNDK